MDQTRTKLQPDRNREAFAERIARDLNGAGTALMLSIGHRTGLFDALAAQGDVTSEQLAEAAGLVERYVREWLGAMVASDIIEVDPQRLRYTLPAAHAALLTRASDENLTVPAQFVAVLGAVEDQVVACFREGGGVPYSAYPRFHEVMAEESAQTVVAALPEHVLPLVHRLVARLTDGIDVLDVGCGSGHAMIELAARYPRSCFTGYDFSAEAVAKARRGANHRGLRNVRFEMRDASQLDEPETYDWITTFDAVHDQARPADVLAAIARALRPSGVYLMQDISGSSHHHADREHPLGPFLYTISCMHCMTVSLAQGGEGLGAMWGREVAERMLREAGFKDVERHTLEHDAMNDWWVCRLDNATL